MDDSPEQDSLEPQDERLRNIDPKMVEMITNEIMYVGKPVEWDDIAGLEFAKTTIQVRNFACHYWVSTNSLIPSRKLLFGLCYDQTFSLDSEDHQKESFCLDLLGLEKHSLVCISINKFNFITDWL
jgi:hypothetical protein